MARPQPLNLLRRQAGKIFLALPEGPALGGGAASGMPIKSSASLAAMATAPKSNAADVAYFQAAEDARTTSHYGVPLHIRNAPTKLMKDLDYGKEYQYDHDFDHHYSYQKYFPDKMAEKIYYQPGEYGFEKEIAKRLEWWKKLREKG